MKRLEGKTFIVTGAGSGMGAKTTELFTKEGAKVLACDINQKGLEQWDSNADVVTLTVDITESAGITKIVDTFKENLGELDGLCNIAGINDLSYPILETDDERWDRVMNIDLKAPFRLTRELLPLMIENGSGSIVNIGSYAALRGNHGPSYTAAKAGLVGLTKSIAFTHASDNIRCNIIHPGGAATNIGETSGGEYHPAQEKLSNIIKAMPVKFYNDPVEIANACLFLCSDESTWVNGSELSVDGGMATC